MKITKTMLKNAGACSAQMETFAKKFPTGVTVTVALCVDHAQDFTWTWAAENLLPQGAYEAYLGAIQPLFQVQEAMCNAVPQYPAFGKKGDWDRIQRQRDAATVHVQAYRNLGRAIAFGIAAGTVPDKKPAAKKAKR